MSNHSTEVPGGTLAKNVLESFFSVTGEPGSFVWSPRHEQIPTNWYKRPVLQSLTVAAVVADAQVNNAMYPGTTRCGGNNGTFNSFTDIDEEDITSGVFNSATLLEANNLACFLLQASMAGLPGWLDGVISDVGDMLGICEESDWTVIGQFGLSAAGEF